MFLFVDDDKLFRIFCSDTDALLLPEDIGKM